MATFLITLILESSPDGILIVRCSQLFLLKNSCLYIHIKIFALSDSFYVFEWAAVSSVDAGNTLFGTDWYFSLPRNIYICSQSFIYTLWMLYIPIYNHLFPAYESGVISKKGRNEILKIEISEIPTLIFCEITRNAIVRDEINESYIWGKFIGFVKN